MKISRARLQVLIREEIAKREAEKIRRPARSASLPTLAEKRVRRQKANRAHRRSGPVTPVNIAKSMLDKIIQEEMQGVLLELDDDRDDDETQHIGGGDSKTHAGVFDYDTGEDEVFEGAEFDDGVATELSEEEEESGPPYERARKARIAREKKAQRTRNQRQADYYDRDDPYGDESPADFRARKAQGIRNKRMGIEDKYGDEAPSDFRARKASKIRKQRLADKRASGELSEDDDNWIQKADADIKRRGTKGRCTGDKFGSESCPEGSREYDLAKTFKKMAHDRDHHHDHDHD